MRQNDRTPMKKIDDDKSNSISQGKYCVDNEVDKNIEKKLLSLVMKNSFVNIVKIDILHRFLSFIS